MYEGAQSRRGSYNAILNLFRTRIEPRNEMKNEYKYIEVFCEHSSCYGLYDQIIFKQLP